MAPSFSFRVPILFLALGASLTAQADVLYAFDLTYDPTLGVGGGTGGLQRATFSFVTPTFLSEGQTNLTAANLRTNAASLNGVPTTVTGLILFGGYTGYNPVYVTTPLFNQGWAFNGGTFHSSGYGTYPVTNAGNGPFYVGSVTLSPFVTPEPAPFAALGLGVFAFRRRRYAKR